jgi:hypothetical protein
MRGEHFNCFERVDKDYAMCCGNFWKRFWTVAQFTCRLMPVNDWSDGGNDTLPASAKLRMLRESFTGCRGWPGDNT